MRKTKYKKSQVVTWQYRGYAMYGVVVGIHRASKRMAYIIFPSDPFGAPEWGATTTDTIKHKWSYQLEAVMNYNDEPRTAPGTVARYNRGEI